MFPPGGPTPATPTAEEEEVGTGTRIFGCGHMVAAYSDTALKLLSSNEPSTDLGT